MKKFRSCHIAFVLIDLFSTILIPEMYYPNVLSKSLIHCRKINTKIFPVTSSTSYLKQTDGETLVDFRGKPDPEVGVDLVRVDDGLHQLVAEDQGQVTILTDERETFLINIGNNIFNLSKEEEVGTSRKSKSYYLTYYLSEDLRRER